MVSKPISLKGVSTVASRLYPTTRRLFRQIVNSLQAFGFGAALCPLTFSLMAVYITGLLLLDRRQNGTRIADWLPARAHDAIEQSGYFAVNILGMEQKEWGMRFAGLQPEVTDRFQGIEWIEAQTGAPILPGVLGWLDCQLRHSLASGDHTIFVGEVAACEVGEGGMPLLYYSRDWRHLAEYAVNPALPEKRGVISTDGVARTYVAVQNSAGNNSEDH